MHSEYIEQRNGGYYLAGTRLSLDSIVYGFLRGQSPEAIMQSFPPVTLTQVYAAITYYLKNRQVIDEYLRESEIEYEKERQAARLRNAQLHAKLDAARSSSR